MASPLHSKQTLTDGIHSTVSYEYASVAAMNSATGFVAEDKYKLSYVTGDASIWLLTNTASPTWVKVSSGSIVTELNASYLLLNVTGSLSNERVFNVSGSTGLKMIDSGPAGSLTVSVNDNFVAMVSGTKFSGPLTASVGLNMLSQSIESAKTVTFFPEFNNGNCGAASTINWANGQKQVMTLTASVSLYFASGSNPPGVSNYLLRVVQGSSSGSFTIIWPPNTICKWPAGTAPTLSTVTSSIDIVTFYFNGTTYFGVASLNFA